MGPNVSGGDLPYVLQRVDSLGGLLDLPPDNLRDQLSGKLGEGAAGGFPLHDLHHLLANFADLRRGSVGRLLYLVRTALGEGDGEEPERVVVGGLDGDVCLDESLPLAHERPELVGGEIKAVEVRKAVLALHLVNSQADLAERVVLVLLKIGERDLEDTALQCVVRILETGGPVNQSLSDTILQSDMYRSCATRITATHSRMLNGDGAYRSMA